MTGLGRLFRPRRTFLGDFGTLEAIGTHRWFGGASGANRCSFARRNPFRRLLKDDALLRVRRFAPLWRRVEMSDPGQLGRVGGNQQKHRNLVPMLAARCRSFVTDPNTGRDRIIQPCPRKNLRPLASATSIFLRQNSFDTVFVVLLQRQHTKRGAKISREFLRGRAAEGEQKQRRQDEETKGFMVCI